MSEWKPKRFWEKATVRSVEDGFAVELDGRPVRTPGKTLLTLPSKELAEAVATEWDAQVDVVDPSVMPMTRSANTAIDRVKTQFKEVADIISEYGGTDLLCYRADSPEELNARQATAWDPILDWAAAELGAKLTTGHGVMHIAQPTDATKALQTQVHALDPFTLTGFHDLVSISGSLILGFAVLRGRLTVEEAWTLSRVDESWQVEQWGEDEEATQHAENKRRDFEHANLFISLANC